MDHQGVGVSWECAASGHGGCHLAGCRCACHYRLGAKEDKSLIERVQTDINRVATPPMEDPLISEIARDKASGPTPNLGPVCLKCGKVAQHTEDKYCRRCGGPVGVVYCGKCGARGDAGDAYCGDCGAGLTEEIAVKSAKPRARRVSQSTSTNTNNNHNPDGL